MTTPTSLTTRERTGQASCLYLAADSAKPSTSRGRCLFQQSATSWCCRSESVPPRLDVPVLRQARDRSRQLHRCWSSCRACSRHTIGSTVHTLVAIGLCVGSQAFEVGADAPDVFASTSTASPNAIDAHWFLDSTASALLQNVGVASASVDELASMQFWPFSRDFFKRRDGKLSAVGPLWSGLPRHWS
jgi:hypothetical protein